MAEPARKLPAGNVFVPLPTGDHVSAECLRDLKRTLEGGSVFILNKDQRYVLQNPVKEQGDVTQEACSRALEELVRVIGTELPEASQDAQQVRQLALRVAQHTTVAPGMQAVLAHALPPALWQPAFTVCIGCGQVRVITMAFVGEPVAGDRPSCKRTPWVLRLQTGDLAASRAAVAATSTQYVVYPAMDGVQSIYGHLEALEPELFQANETGEWTKFRRVAPQRASSRAQQPQARRPAAEPRTRSLSVQSLQTWLTGLPGAEADRSGAPASARHAVAEPGPRSLSVQSLQTWFSGGNAAGEGERSRLPSVRRQNSTGEAQQAPPQRSPSTQSFQKTLTAPPLTGSEGDGSSSIPAVSAQRSLEPAPRSLSVQSLQTWLTGLPSNSSEGDRRQAAEPPPRSLSVQSLQALFTVAAPSNEEERAARLASSTRPAATATPRSVREKSRRQATEGEGSSLRRAAEPAHTAQPTPPPRSLSVQRLQTWFTAVAGSEGERRRQAAEQQQQQQQQQRQQGGTKKVSKTASHQAPAPLDRGHRGRATVQPRQGEAPRAPEIMDRRARMRAHMQARSAAQRPLAMQEPLLAGGR